MKALIRDKAIEIILGMLFSFVLLFAGFYYNTQNDVSSLKQSCKDIDYDVNSLELRMNEKDVQYREILVKLDYISMMIEEIKRANK